MSPKQKICKNIITYYKVYRKCTPQKHLLTTWSNYDKKIFISDEITTAMSELKISSIIKEDKEFLILNFIKSYDLLKNQEICKGMKISYT
jgi:hypothetical protein